MTALRVFLARLRSLFGRHRHDAELRAEIDGIDPVVPITEIRTGEDHADLQLGVVRLTAEVSMLLTSVGLVAGLGASLLLTPVLRSLLFNLPPNDPLTFGAVGMALVVIALIASYVPARRASRIDPIATLRTE